MRGPQQTGGVHAGHGILGDRTAIGLTIQPGQVTYLLVIAALAGIGILPVYPARCLVRGCHRMGRITYRPTAGGDLFGVRAFIRKVAGALVIFITLQALGWSGYQTPPEGVTQFMQPDSQLKNDPPAGLPVWRAHAFGSHPLYCPLSLTRERYERIQKAVGTKKSADNHIKISEFL